MASYQLYDLQGNDVTPQELQAKGAWCISGATKEDVFVEKHGKDFGLIINPEKAGNPYAPDLCYESNGKIADLKTQNTPFFQATRYNLPAQTSVTFNLKDQKRYNELYPDVDIIYWVDWQAVKFKNNYSEIFVEPMTGIWRINMKVFNNILEKAPQHSYMQRKFDTKGNAKSSYVVNLENPLFERIL